MVNMSVVYKVALVKHGLDNGESTQQIADALVRIFPQSMPRGVRLTIGSAKVWIAACRKDGKFSFKKIEDHRSDKEKGTGPGPEKAKEEIAAVKALDPKHVAQVYEGKAKPQLEAKAAPKPKPKPEPKAAKNSKKSKKKVRPKRKKSKK